MSDKGQAKKRQKDQPVSFHPLDPKEALADLMKVKPEVKKSKGKRARPNGPERGT